MRGAASITVSRMSCTGSRYCSPYPACARVVWRISAASSTPVAPAPMITMSTPAGCPSPARPSARTQAASSRRWKRLASRRRIERNRVRCDTRHAEIVALAADAENQHVVGHVRARAASRRPSSSMTCLQREFARCRSRPATAPWHEAKAMPVRQRQIVDVVRVGIHATGRDLMQQRLPDVRLVRSTSVISAWPWTPELLAQRSGERQSARAAADDHDPDARTRGRCPGSFAAHRAFASRSAPPDQPVRVRTMRAGRCLSSPT